MSTTDTDTVDTPAADTAGQDWAGSLGWLPDVTAVPRESAMDTLTMTVEVLAGVRAREQAMTGDAGFAADVRRRLAVLESTVIRRRLSRTATHDMAAAMRITERALGLAMGDASWSQWQALVPDKETRDRCLALAAGDDPPTEQGVDTVTVEDDAVIPDDSTAAVVTAGLAYLAEAGRLLGHVTAADMAGLSPERAGDLARAIWLDAVPVLTARQHFMRRGAQ